MGKRYSSGASVHNEGDNESVEAALYSLGIVVNSGGTSFNPTTDNTTDLGTPTKRYKTVYATGISNGTGILDIPSETTAGAALVTTNNSQSLSEKIYITPQFTSPMSLYGDGFLTPTFRIRKSSGSAKIISCAFPEPAVDGTATLAFPNTSTTMVGTDTTNTLTNKSLGTTAILGNLVPDTDSIREIGSSANRYLHVYTDNINGYPFQITDYQVVSFAPDQGPIAVLSGANQSWILTKYANGSVSCVIPRLANIAQSNVATFRSPGLIPSQFRPVAAMTSGYMFVLNDNGYKVGGLSIQGTGTVYVAASVGLGNFINAGNVGWEGQVIWWNTT
jgi:hypothetical protein